MYKKILGVTAVSAMLLATGSSYAYDMTEKDFATAYKLSYTLQDKLETKDAATRVGVINKLDKITTAYAVKNPRVSKIVEAVAIYLDPVTCAKGEVV